MLVQGEFPSLIFSSFTHREGKTTLKSFGEKSLKESFKSLHHFWMFPKQGIYFILFSLSAFVNTLEKNVGEMKKKYLEKFW